MTKKNLGQLLKFNDNLSLGINFTGTLDAPQDIDKIREAHRLLKYLHGYRPQNLNTSNIANVLALYHLFNAIAFLEDYCEKYPLPDVNPN